MWLASSLIFEEAYHISLMYESELVLSSFMVLIYTLFLTCQVNSSV